VVVVVTVVADGAAVDSGTEHSEGLALWRGELFEGHASEEFPTTSA